MKTKLYIGYRLSPELKVLIRDKMPEAIFIATHQGKEFLGAYITDSFPTVKVIHQKADEVLASLQLSFPSYFFNRGSISVFPVVLLGG